MNILSPSEHGTEEASEFSRTSERVRDLDSEREAIKEAIDRQSAASREYLSGRFKLS